MKLFSLEKYKILIVDDFGNYRFMLKTMLHDYNANDIDDVGNGPQAVNMIAKNKYDIILCDYNLGAGQDGQQILEEVKHRELIDHETIFIMLTAESSLEMVMGAVEYQPDDYLTKPFTKEVMIKRLQRVIHKKDIIKHINLFTEQKQFKKALQACDLAMQNSQKYVMDIAKLKSNIYLKMNKLNAAEKVFNKMLTIREFPWAKLGLAKVKMANNQIAEAEVLFKELISQHNVYIEAYDHLAKIYQKNSKLKDAQKVLMSATAISPKTIERQKMLGALAEIDVAEKAYKAAVNFGKHSYLKSASDNVGLAKVYIMKNLNNKALKVIQDAQKDYKNDKDGLFHTQLIEAQILKDENRDFEARKLFEILRNEYNSRMDELPTDIAIDMATSCDTFGDKKNLRKLLDRLSHTDVAFQVDHLKHSQTESAEKNHDDDYIQLNKAGMKLYERGKIEQAIEMFEQAAENLPNNISVNMNAAQAIISIMEKKGITNTNLEDARYYLDHAKSHDQDNSKYIELEKRYASILEQCSLKI